MDAGGRVTQGAVTEMANLSGLQFCKLRRNLSAIVGWDFYVQDVRSVFLFPTKTKYLHPCKQFGGAMDGKEHLWFRFFWPI